MAADVTDVQGVPGGNPVPVTVVGEPPTPTAPALRVQHQETDPSLAAKTTFQEDLTTAGQRQVNLIWESTQGKVALYVIVGTMIIDGAATLLSIGFARELTGTQIATLAFVNSLATGVVAFYFSRTNHTQIGGTGNKPNEEYKGR